MLCTPNIDFEKDEFKLNSQTTLVQRPYMQHLTPKDMITRTLGPKFQLVIQFKPTQDM